jgi:hypothetical protein
MAILSEVEIEHLREEQLRIGSMGAPFAAIPVIDDLLDTIADLQRQVEALQNPPEPRCEGCGRFRMTPVGDKECFGTVVEMSCFSDYGVVKLTTPFPCKDCLESMHPWFRAKEVPNDNNIQKV